MTTRINYVAASGGGRICADFFGIVVGCAALTGLFVLDVDGVCPPCRLGRDYLPCCLRRWTELADETEFLILKNTWTFLLSDC